MLRWTVRTAAIAVMTTLVCSLCTAAELTLQREGRPRLASPEQVEALRADAEAVEAARALADDIIARERTSVYRDHSVALPAPAAPLAHEGDWPWMTGISGELRAYLEGTARAWALTGDRRYLGWCRELMLAVSAWDQWHDPAVDEGPSVATVHLIHGICVGLDLTWDALPEGDRAVIVAAIADKGAHPVYDHFTAEDSYLSSPNIWPNGYAMLSEGLGVAALTLLGEDERADEWLAKSLTSARLFLDEQGGTDGGLVEGLAYGGLAVDALVHLSQVAGELTGTGIFDHRYFEQAILFPAYFMAPGGGTVANFGDNGGPAGCPPAMTGLARALVEREDDAVAAWYLSKAGDSDKPAVAPEHLPLARYFRDIDWVAMRSGWGEADSLLAFKSGYAEHHNHLDQNSLLLAWGDEWLLNDPGYQVFDMPYPPERRLSEEMVRARHDYTYGTLGHNAILVDGRGQIARRGYVTEFLSSPAMDYAVGDASDCYPGLKRYRRHVISVAPDYYAIFDEIASDGPARKIELLLHTTPDGEFSIDGAELPVGESVEGREARIRRTGEAVTRFVSPASLRFEHRRERYCEPYGRYLSASVGIFSDETVAWVVGAGPAGRVRLQARPVEGADAIQLQVGDAVDTIALGGEESVSVADISFTGAAAMVRDSRAGVHRYALVEGTRLQVGVATMIASETPISAGAVVEDGLLRARISSEASAAVTLFCPPQAGTVTIDGAEVTEGIVRDPERLTVSLSIPAGDHEVEVRG